MAKYDPIDPFPSDIDRQHFAGWFTGFSDGEGHFSLSVPRGNQRPTPSARFSIALRDDDSNALQLVQSFFGCGTFFRDKRVNAKNGGSPQISLRFQRVFDLTRVIIPHFEMFPLLGKKRYDYRIWKEGVLYMASILKRRRPPKQVGKGLGARWRDVEIAHFAAIAACLKGQRRYQASESPLPTPPPKSLPKDLFGDS